MVRKEIRHHPVGTLQPNLVPKDKFKQENIVRTRNFTYGLGTASNRTKFHWLNEKHLLNRDVEAQVSRPTLCTLHLCQRLRDAWAGTIISASPTKEGQSPTHWARKWHRRMRFWCSYNFLLSHNWFERGDILIMDNASIHTGRAVMSRTCFGMRWGPGRLPANAVAGAVRLSSFSHFGETDPVISVPRNGRTMRQGRLDLTCQV
jgi:hypothetical protein